MTENKKAILAVVVLFAVSLAARTEEKANPLDKAPSQFAKMDDIRIHYKSLGSGDTALVFVHGWTADLNFWRYQVHDFEGEFRMILIDLPGHGESDKPKIDYTMDLFARSIDAVLKETGVNKAVLAGHSMGTPVIRQFYRLYPKKTAALIAVDGSLRRPNFKPGQLEQFVKQFSGPAWKENYAKFLDSMLTDQTPEEVRRAIKESAPRAPQHVAVSAMKEMFNPVNWKDDKIEVPLQAIMAKNPRWSPDYVEYVRKLAPQVDYQVMDGVGHFLMMEKPDTFNSLMDDFLKKEGLLKQ